MPQRQSVGNDLDAPCVSDWHIVVHVGQPGLAIEASADLQAEHHQTVSRLPAWLELGVGAELACFGLLQGQCRSRLSPCARESISLDEADQRRVDRDLRASRSKVGGRSRRPRFSGRLWRGARLSSRKATFVATRAPASWQMRATARSSGPALWARTPICAQEERWSPRLSRRPPHRHRVLSARALPLEHAVARVCREAGARVVALLRRLARARARDRVPWARAAAIAALTRRWTTLAALAALRAHVQSLLELPIRPCDVSDGAELPLGELLAEPP